MFQHGESSNIASREPQYKFRTPSDIGLYCPPPEIIPTEIRVSEQGMKNESSAYTARQSPKPAKRMNKKLIALRLLILRKAPGFSLLSS